MQKRSPLFISLLILALISLYRNMGMRTHRWRDSEGYLIDLRENCALYIPFFAFPFFFCFSSVFFFFVNKTCPAPRLIPCWSLQCSPLNTIKLFYSLCHSDLFHYHPPFMRQVLVHCYYYFFCTQKHRIDGLTTLSIPSIDIKKLY
jgi:hypothetical protein